MYTNLDQIDIKILSHLQRNAKIPVREMSEKIHLSQSAIHARIKNLESEAYIKNYGAVLDKTKVNKNLVSFISLQLSTNASKHVRDSLKLISEFPEVINCYLVNGKYDFLLHVAVADMQEYNQFFLNVLSKIESVESSNTFFVIGELKEHNWIDLSVLFKKFTNKPLKLD